MFKLTFIEDRLIVFWSRQNFDFVFKEYFIKILSDVLYIISVDKKKQSWKFDQSRRTVVSGSGSFGAARSNIRPNFSIQMGRQQRNPKSGKSLFQIFLESEIEVILSDRFSDQFVFSLFSVCFLNSKNGARYQYERVLARFLVLFYKKGRLY